jgi:hypothetical protein
LIDFFRIFLLALQVFGELAQGHGAAAVLGDVTDG